jgi:hypothetical protein
MCMYMCTSCMHAIGSPLHTDFRAAHNVSLPSCVALRGGDRMGWITAQARLQAVLKAPVVIHIDFNALTSSCTTSQERLKVSGHAFVLMHVTI